MSVYTNTNKSRLLFAISKAITVVVAVGLGIQISALFRHEPSRLMQQDYLLTYFGAFVVLTIVLLLNQDKISIKLHKNNILIEIENIKQTLSIDEIEKITLTGYFVKRMNLTMKDGVNKKIQLGAFSRKNIQQLVNDLKQLYPNKYLTRS